MKKFQKEQTVSDKQIRRADTALKARVASAFLDNLPEVHSHMHDGEAGNQPVWLTHAGVGHAIYHSRGFGFCRKCGGIAGSHHLKAYLFIQALPC